MKFLIINADDFGYGAGVNRAIVLLHDQGVVTSAALMVNTPGTAEAVALASTRPRLALGLHVNFTNEAERRFLERLEDPEKNWKFSANDIKERAFWDDYMAAYQDMIRHTAAPHAPWYVVPADNKWFSRLVVAAAIVEALEGLDLHYPKVGAGKKKELAAARRLLAGERN